MAGKGVQLGFLKYVLGFDTLAFKKGISQADADLAKLQKSFAAKGREFQALGTKLTALVTLPLAGLAAAGIKEARETAEAMAQVNSALKSTGGQAGVTAKQLQDASNSLELHSLYEGDQILKNVSARLLAFGNVTGQTFARAQQVIVDYATRTGADLGAATVLIGKALNDPAKAMGVLRKAGVTLSESQQELIKNLIATGNTAGAQAVLIGALETKFKGAAQAAQDVDPWNKMSDAFKSIAESIGTLLLPIIPPLADALASVAQWFTSLDPTTQKWVAGLAAVAAAAGPLLIIVGNLITVVSKVGVLVQFTAGLTGLAAAEGVAAGGATAAGIAIRGMLGPIGLAITAAFALYEAFKHWPEIKNFVQSMVTGVANHLRGRLHQVFEDTKSDLETLKNKFRELRDKVVTHSYVPEMVDGIAAQMRRLDGVMVAPAKNATAKVSAAFRELSQQTSSLLGRLYPDDGKNNQILEDIKTLDAAQKQGLLTTNQWADAIQRLYQTDPGSALADSKPLEKLTGGFNEFEAANDDIVVTAKKTGAEIARAYGDMAQNVIGSIKDMVGQLKSGDILGALQSVLSVVKSVVDTLVSTGVIHLGGATPTPRAKGGPVVPGKTYLVGENGPEYVNFGSRGYVTPPGKGGGAARVTIVPSEYFRAVVQGEAANVAGPMAGQAAVVGASGGMSGIARRQARRIP